VLLTSDHKTSASWIIAHNTALNRTGPEAALLGPLRASRSGGRL
jgi:hypothetical protein